MKGKGIVMFVLHIAVTTVLTVAAIYGMRNLPGIGPLIDKALTGKF